jgi:hypothetical protein
MTAYVPRRHEADAGLVQDDDASSSARIYRPSSIASPPRPASGGRRMTDVRHSCRPSWPVPVGPTNSVGPLRADDLAAMARRRGSAGVRTMDGCHAPWCWLGARSRRRRGWAGCVSAVDRMPAGESRAASGARSPPERDGVDPMEEPISEDKAAVSVGLRVLIARGYNALGEITDDDLAQIPSGTRGQDGLDVALCRLGTLTRTPQRGTTRRSRRPRRTIAELVAMADLPTPSEPSRYLSRHVRDPGQPRLRHAASQADRAPPFLPISGGAVPPDHDERRRRARAWRIQTGWRREGRCTRAQERLPALRPSWLCQY